MKEIPILFSTEMVRAILDDRKRMTRRINYNDECSICCAYGRKKCGVENFCAESKYKIGDILWVRETWCDLPFDSGYIYKEDCENILKKWKSPIFMPKEAARIWLRVKDVRVERLQYISEDDALKEGASEAVRADESCGGHIIRTARNSFEWIWDSINGKRTRRKRGYVKEDMKGYKWEDNPFVWVIEFERIER